VIAPPTGTGAAGHWNCVVSQMTTDYVYPSSRRVSGVNALAKIRQAASTGCRRLDDGYEYAGPQRDYFADGETVSCMHCFAAFLQRLTLTDTLDGVVGPSCQSCYATAHPPQCVSSSSSSVQKDVVLPSDLVGCRCVGSDDPFDHVNQCDGACFKEAIANLRGRTLVRQEPDTPEEMEKSIHLTKDMLKNLLSK